MSSLLEFSRVILNVIIDLIIIITILTVTQLIKLLPLQYLCRADPLVLIPVVLSIGSLDDDCCLHPPIQIRLKQSILLANLLL